MIGRPRLCADCGHVHGGKGYGLCFERLANGDVCPCIVARIVVILFERPREPCERTLCRRAAKAYAELTPDQRAKYDRAARRLDETDLTVHEYAAEAGLDEKLLWRARRDLGLQSARSAG